MDILFFKSSRFREYQRENLRILEANDGEHFRIHYPRNAVQAELLSQDLQGLPVLFVLSDSPHERRAPVRHGRILAVHDEGERIEFALRLTAFAQVDLDCQAFDDWAKKQPACCDKPAMVFRPTPSIQPDSPFEFAEPDGRKNRPEKWRAAIDRLLASDSARHYADSVFLLPLGLKDEDTDRPADPTALSTGRTYTHHILAYAPQLKAENRARCSFGLGFDRTELELLQAPEKIPADGEVVLRFRPLVPGSARLNVHVRPHSERSSRLVLDVHASGSEIQRLFTCEEVAGESVREGLRGLLALLHKQKALELPKHAAAVLELMLQLAPDDDELNRELAMLEHKLGRHDQATERYRNLGAEALAPEDWQPYFISACHAAAGTEVLRESLDHLPWELLNSDQAQAMGKCLAQQGEGLILSLLEPLAYFGTERFMTDIWAYIWPAIRSTDGLLSAHRILRETHLDKPEVAYATLQERSADDGLHDARIDELLVDLGLEQEQAPRSLAEILLRHLRRLADAGQLDRAQSMLERARPRMNPGGFEQLRTALADHLVENAQPAPLRLAGWLFAEAAEAARLRGDLDEATWLLERSALAHPESDRLPKVQQSLEKSINAIDSMQLLGEALFGQRIKKLRDRMAGKRLVIAGGSHEKPWTEELRQELALAEVVWHPSQLGKPPRVEKLRESLNKTVGAVAV
ncbi:MAG: hypothetical protein JRF33_27530, partial [Deltaproteobacteria bacterium]|nr:hypothetical protein [Deltaproteobacteria bacterium]